MDSFGKVNSSPHSSPRKFVKTPAYKDPEDLLHELTHAKTQINQLTKDKKILSAKISMLARGNAKLERRNDEAMISASLGVRGEENKIGLKNANTLQEKRIRGLEGEIGELKRSLRFTKVVEMEVELKAYYQEV
jgi:predicted RNase H-like nuclease (RuvC/YqgF family)